MNINDTIKKAEKDYGLDSGAYFKVKEGSNKIRVLTEALPYQSYYKGNKTFKFVGWICDYVDGKVKLYFFPKTVYEAIGSLQVTEDYAFEDMPMPYDVSINAKNAGTKEVEYQVMPARSNTPVDQEILTQLAGKKTIEEVIAQLKENDSKNGNTAPEPQHQPVQSVQDEPDFSQIPF